MDNREKSGVLRFGGVLLVGVVLAGGMGAAISFLKGEESFLSERSTVIWGLTASVFLISVVLYRLFLYVFRCSECGRPASDILVYDGQHRRRYCREHMLEAFRKEFVGFRENMVVFYPSLEFKTGGFVYQYRVLEDVPEKYRDDRTGRMLANALDSIAGNCSKCGRAANVAYFGPGSFQWLAVRKAGVKREYPKFDEVTVRPENLCRECVVGHVAYSLLNFNSQFVGGIVLPYKGKGAMLPGLSDV